MKTETLLLVGIAAAAGWYFFIRKPQPAQPAQPAQQITNITQAKRTNWQDVAISGINAAGSIAGKFVPGT
jgi:hypothetical protein